MYLSDCWPWRGLGDDLAYRNTIRAQGVSKRYLPHWVCRIPWSPHMFWWLIRRSCVYPGMCWLQQDPLQLDSQDQNSSVSHPGIFWIKDLKTKACKWSSCLSSERTSVSFDGKATSMAIAQRQPESCCSEGRWLLVSKRSRLQCVMARSVVLVAGLHSLWCLMGLPWWLRR